VSAAAAEPVHLLQQIVRAIALQAMLDEYLPVLMGR